METFACLFRIKASRSMPEIHGCKPVGQRSFRGWRREGRSRSPGQVSGWGIPQRDSPATGSSEAKGRVLLGRPGPAPHALLSSTLTARGLIAPVRFSGEAAEGGACSFTAPRLGFSSTRCLAFRQMDGDRGSQPCANMPARTHGPTTCFLLLRQRKATLRSPSFVKDQTQKCLSWAGPWLEKALLPPRALSAVIRRGRRPRSQGSICATQGPLQERPTQGRPRDLLKSTHPRPCCRGMGPLIQLGLPDPQPTRLPFCGSLSPSP